MLFSQCPYEMTGRALETTYRRFVKESQALLAAFDAPLSGDSCIVPHRLARDMCVVRLQDAWMRACKEVFMSSACDEPLTPSGQVVHRVVPSRAQVLPALRSTFTGHSKKPLWWEPDWGNPRVFLDASSRLGLSNYATLSLGMSITPSPTDNVRKIRNFLAHRNRDTADLVAEVARFYLLAPESQAEQIITAFLPPGISIFESWVDDLRVMVRTIVS